MSKLSTRDVIKLSAIETKLNGYVKRSEDENDCTANRIIDAIETNEYSDEDLESVKDRISEWFAYVNDTNNSGEYFENLRSEITKPMIDEVKIGLIASSFSLFDKNKQFGKSKERDKQSEYLVEEGDEISFEISDYKLIKTGTSKFGNNTNKWYLYKIYSGSNVIIWFSNYKCDTEFSHSNKATATVSKLSEYNGCKQTNVSRLKFE